MKNTRILGEDERVDNWSKGINSNDLIVGVSGAGKTRGYVIPNLFYGNDSKIVADTKGNLFRKYGPVLKKMGYKVENIDFVNPENSTVGYNPLEMVKYDNKTGFDVSDIRKIAEAICPMGLREDIFWPQQGRMYLEFGISYVLYTYGKRDRVFSKVENVMSTLDSDNTRYHVDKLEDTWPGCQAARIYPKIVTLMESERTHASIMGFVNNSLNQLSDSEISLLYNMRRKLSFEKLGKEKTVLFLTISDTDRTRECLVNLFYTQALQELVRAADASPESRLDVPVRLILDDFASNAVIPDFDKTISIIRSRGISVSIILQSITQLKSMYGEATGMTITDNCDVQIYLGGQSLFTARYFGEKMNKLPETVLSLPLDEECLFIRGQQPRIVKKYDLAKHEDELMALGDAGAEHHDGSADAVIK